MDFLLDNIRRHPGEITLFALGPLTNLAAALQRDPATFRGLRRIVLMGGSVRQGYVKSAYHAPPFAMPSPPDKEYNIVSDIAAARAVFNAGVPIVMMPLDATQIRLEEAARNALFAQGTPLSDALALLYHQWIDAVQPWSSLTPTLFDVVPIAYAIDPSLCPTAALRIFVDADGMTREAPGTTQIAGGTTPGAGVVAPKADGLTRAPDAANAQVCLAADVPRLLDLVMRRLLAPAIPAR